MERWRSPGCQAEFRNIELMDLRAKSRSPYYGRPRQDIGCYAFDDHGLTNDRIYIEINSAPFPGKLVLHCNTNRN